MFPATRFAARSSRLSFRQIHSVPNLKNHASFAENGVQGLYSKQGFENAWLNYQKYLTTSLTLNTTGTEYEGKTPYQVLLLTARKTTEQHTFHYASQAFSNHFFFEQLADQNDAQLTKPLRFLMERLADQDIGSVEQLKLKVLALSEQILGQGWIFLVELPDKSVQLMACNNDGTPFFHGKNQSLDLNGSIPESSFEQLLALKAKGEELDFTLPLLAINLWDVAFLDDFGIAGRREYLSKVWDCINWDVVNKRMFQI